MNIFEKFLNVFGIRRMDLDKPITLLGKDYYELRDKILDSTTHSECDDVDWGIHYRRHDEEDSSVKICTWETIKIISTLIHDDNGRILRAGKIYIDTDERFIDQVISTVTAWKSKVLGKVRYPHYNPSDDDYYYHYSDEVYLRVHKGYDPSAKNWRLEVEYILHKPLEKKKTPAKRTVSEDRARIMNDIRKHLE